MAKPGEQQSKPRVKPARNDGFLNTGLSSAVERRHQQKLETMQKAKKDERGRLTPQADIILEWLQQEKDEVGNLEKSILDFDMEKIRALVPLAKQLDVSNKDLLQAQIIARFMHLEWLKKMESKVKGVLRETKDTVVQGESFSDEEK